MKPRPYQEKAIRHILEYAAKHPSGRLLVVLPPGGGKTLIAAHVLRLLAADQWMRGLTWAHRRELVGQMRDHLVRCGVPEHMLGVVMAGDKRINPSAHIQVTSVDTLRHRDKPPADVIVSDEAHRDASDGRRKLRSLYPDALHVGFTATPERLDGRGLHGDYDEMYIAAQPSELIADGYLAAPKIYTVPKELLPDVRGVRSVGGDYHAGDLERTVARKQLLGSIVEHWKARADGRPTIVFPVGVRHSKAIVAQFRSAGVTAEHLDALTPHNERAALLMKLADGRVSIVSSCGVLSEGVDVPEVKCVVMARPTKSLALSIQQGGRCMRPHGDLAPLILDHAGNIMIHLPPQHDHQWSLRAGKRRATGPRCRACPACNAVVPLQATLCPECGSVMVEHRDMVPVESAGDLKAYGDLFSTEEKRAELDRILAFSKSRGLPDEWARRVYAAKFGELAA